MRVIVLGLAAWVAGAWAPLPAAAQGAGAEAVVDSLLERGRLQEAAWTLRAAGDTAGAEEVLVRLEGRLRGWPEAATPLAMDSQGVSYTWRLDHGAGVRSIFKVDGSDIFCPECGADREVATYRIDRVLAMDLTPMTIRTRIRNQQGDTLSGSTMYFVADARSPPDEGAGKPDALRLFDAIIGNSDRHPNNWLLVGDRVVAIDHNRAFEYQPTTRPTTCWEAEIDSIAEPGDLGRPWRRYRSLPADSFEAVLAGIDTVLVHRFLDMRPAVVARVEARIEAPGRALPRSDCGVPE
ncbi:MAG: hypothetical protein R6U63_05315 [Longimicrobiales bacterium]